MELPTRKNMRLKDYDYSQNGAYFLTLCVKDRHEMLGEVKNGQSLLNEYGVVIKEEIENISIIRKECVIEKFVIMPNHIHLIAKITTIVGDDGNRPVASRSDCVTPRSDFHPPLRRSIPNMVQGLKGAVTRKIGFSLWQRGYHDRIIRNEDEYLRIRRYIDENPAKWEDDIYFIRTENGLAHNQQHRSAPYPTPKHT